VRRAFFACDVVAGRLGREFLQNLLEFAFGVSLRGIRIELFQLRFKKAENDLTGLIESGVEIDGSEE
jgi:hypothetical protein